MNLDERLQKDLSPDIYCLIHNKIVNLEQKCKKQKEVIDKLSKIIYEIDDLRKATGGYPSHYLDELLDILNEVSE